MSHNTVSNTVTLTTNDGKLFEISLTVAKQSELISRGIEDISTDKPFPLLNVTELVLKKVLDYCEKHNDEASPYNSEEELMKWDAQFLNVDMKMLFDLIMAANYMEIKGLLKATCKKVADMMAGKRPEVIRQTFNINNDYTPTEEEEVRHEHEWAFA